MNRTASVLLLAAMAANLAACAAPGTYPSLARRPIETAQPPAPPAGPDTPALADPAMIQRVSALVDQVRAAHAGFAERRARAEQAVAAGRGAAVGTDGWAAANVALARLEASRSEAMIAMAELDRLDADERLAHYNERSGNGGAIAAARDQAIPLIDEEDRILAALRERLGS